MTDTQLATPELGSVEVGGVTRSAFILRGALAAGAVYGAGTVGPFVSEALAQGGGSDVDILNFALTLEYLEAAFYKRAQTEVKLDTKTMALAKRFGDEEQQHVQTLSAAIRQAGGKPVTAPTVSFPLADQASFLKLGQTFEDTGVSAYNGAAPSISSKQLLAAAGSIVQVEARHAAAIRLAADHDPSPNAFDPTLSKPQVLTAVKPFIK